MMVQTQDVVSTVREKFNFTVDKFPLSGPDGMQTPWYALFRSDTSTVVGNGSVTKQYVPHTTDDVVALVEAAATAMNGIADVDCYFRDGHYVFIRPSVEDRREIYANDWVCPRFNISFGFDGKSCKSTVGLYRITCANLTTMRSVRESTVCFRHTRNLRAHMQELIDTFGTLGDSWNSVVNAMERMESNKVNLVNFLDAIYGKPDQDSKRAVTVHRDRTERIVKRLLNEQGKLNRPAMGSDFMVTGWEAYNAVQGYTQHEVTRKGRNGTFDGAKLLLSLASTEVAEAERLALAM